MSEWRLFAGAVPEVSTLAFHADRSRAPHLEQAAHRGRLHRARDFVAQAAADGARSASDLGCGDGGLLSLLREIPSLESWGYDFAPANATGWPERGVTAEALDVFGADRHRVRLGEVAVMTEVLEHLADPHGVLAWTRASADWLVCSSPWNETGHMHDACHAWAWDLEGYAKLVQDAGWTIDRHEQVDLFQVILAH